MSHTDEIADGGAGSASPDPFHGQVRSDLYLSKGEAARADPAAPPEAPLQPGPASEAASPVVGDAAGQQHAGKKEAREEQLADWSEAADFLGMRRGLEAQKPHHAGPGANEDGQLGRPQAANSPTVGEWSSAACASGEGTPSPAISHERATLVAVVALCLSLFLSVPLTSMLLGSLFVNVFLAGVVLALCQRTAQLETRLGLNAPARNAGPTGQNGAAEDGDGIAAATAAEVLQQLVGGAWAFSQRVASRLQPRGIVKSVLLGQAPPAILAVLPGAAPERGVCCLDVELVWGALPDPAAPKRPPLETAAFAIELQKPWHMRIWVMRFEAIVQFYCWGTPPEGRGRDFPYTLIEAALAPDTPRPPVVVVQLEALEDSTILQRLLPHLQQAAVAVLESRVVPRLTGWDNRVTVEERRPDVRSASLAQAAEGEMDWQREARRAGWLPRFEAELEGAVVDLVRNAGGKAWETAGAASENLQNMVHATASAVQRPSELTETARAVAGRAWETAAGASDTLHDTLKGQAMAAWETLQGPNAGGEKSTLLPRLDSTAWAPQLYAKGKCSQSDGRGGGSPGPPPPVRPVLAESLQVTTPSQELARQKPQKEVQQVAQQAAELLEASATEAAANAWAAADHAAAALFGSNFGSLRRSVGSR